MISLKTAKQITLKKNSDGTYNMTTVDDIYEDDGITLKYTAEIEYFRVQIKNFDVDVLMDEKNQKICDIKKN